MLNVQATKKVATLALKIKQLKAFVHVSTAYVNCNLPRGSHIEEQIYPLYHKNGKKLEHKKIAIKLAALPPAKAEAEVHPIRLKDPAVSIMLARPLACA